MGNEDVPVQLSWWQYEWSTMMRALDHSANGLKRELAESILAGIFMSAVEISATGTLDVQSLLFGIGGFGAMFAARFIGHLVVAPVERHNELAAIIQSQSIRMQFAALLRKRWEEMAVIEPLTDAVDHIKVARNRLMAHNSALLVCFDH